MATRRITYKRWQWTELCVLVLACLGTGISELTDGPEPVILALSALIGLLLIHIFSWLIPAVRQARGQ